MTAIGKIQTGSIVVGIAGAAAFVAAFFLPVQRELIFRAYLFGYLCCLGLALGSMCLLMLHALTGGEWGDRIRPAAHAAMLTLPLLALLFIPLCFGLRALYPWARPEELAGSHTLLHRQAYLNATFFYIRAAAYFVIWIGLALLVHWRPWARALCAPGLIIYLMTMTHAGIDWLMSRDIEFYSTAFGFVLTVGQTLSAMALAVVLLPLLPKRRPAPSPPAKLALLNDLGNLLLTMVILWAYVAFMQLLVIWMGNTTEDNGWYLERGLGGGGDSLAWRIVGGIILLFEFFVPFYLLLFRKIKQRSRSLLATAWILLLAHGAEEYWLVAPSGNDGAARFDPHWVDLAALAGLLGIWLTAFLLMLGRAPAEAMPEPQSETGAAVHG